MQPAFCASVSASRALNVRVGSLFGLREDSESAGAPLSSWLRRKTGHSTPGVVEARLFFEELRGQRMVSGKKYFDEVASQWDEMRG